MASSFPKSLLQRLERQRHAGEYCDIEIFVGEMVFRGHKCVLAAASPRLENDIKTAEMEYCNNANVLYRSKIELSGISVRGFEALFNYIYSGELQINDENADEVSTAAMILDVGHALDACTEYKRKQFAVSSLPFNAPRALTGILETPGHQINENTQNIESIHTSGITSTHNVPDFPVEQDANLNPSSSRVKVEDEVMSVISPPLVDGYLPAEQNSTKKVKLHSRSSSGNDNHADLSGGFPAISQSFAMMDSDPNAPPTLLSYGSESLQTPFPQNIQSLGFNNKTTCVTSSNNFATASNLGLRTEPSGMAITDNAWFNQNSAVFYTEEKDENGPVWRCNICNKRFQKLSYLKYVHIRLHNGKRPFRCNLCNKEFATKGNLLQHHKVHLAKNGIMPYKCKFCKRPFALKGNCRKHENTHTKPYRCEYCPRVFTAKNDCLQHIAKHHAEANLDTVGLRCSKCLCLFSESFGEEYLNHSCGI